MKANALLFFLLPILVSARYFDNIDGEGEIWALLLAGAKDWGNYRYQADVSHSYQVLHENGIPDDHIIVMLYDDVANHSLNVHPGQLFNEVGGPDVYTGMPKDYIGESVTPDTFLKVLSGDEKAVEGLGSGKVVKSGPNDRIFISMDDHGSPGFFYFPGFVPMSAVDFSEVIIQMHKDGKYKELMVYMEACEGGTMFENIYPDEVFVYASTSSNTKESSWACEYDEEIGNWLACEFPLGWMRDTEAKDPSVETLLEQYESVRDGISSAHVSRYGNLAIQDEVVGNFLGNRTTAPKPYKGINEASRIRTQDVHLALLEKQLNSANNEVKKEEIRSEIASYHQNQKIVLDTMKQIALLVTKDETLTEELLVKKPIKITQWDCYSPVGHAFHDCFDEDKREHAPLVIHTLLDLCERGFNKQDILSAIEKTC